MGLLDRITGMARRVKGPSPGGGFFFVGPSRAGIRVDEQVALTYSAVWGCVRVISETVASLPWRVYRHEGELRNLDPQHPLDFLLHRRPNPEMSAFTFRCTLQSHALLYGNGYAEIERDSYGNVLALWPITPDRVTPKRTAAGRLYYEVAQEGAESVDIQPDHMLHLPGLAFDGIKGYGVVEMAKESIGLGLAAEKFGADFFGGGGMPSGWVEVPPGVNLSEDAAKNLIKSIAKQANGKSVWPLDQGMKFHGVSIPPEQGQFLESRKFQVTDICRWFRVPPHKLADLERATFSNIEHQSIEFVTDAVLPWVVRWEQEVDAKCFGEKDRGAFTKLAINGLLRGDAKARAEYYQIMTRIGAFSINDVLKLEDRNPIGPAGDLRVVMANMVSIENAGQPQQKPAQIAQAQAAVFHDVADRMRRKEANALERAEKKHEGDALQAWRADFYAKHKEQMVEAFAPAVEALAKLLGADADFAQRAAAGRIAQYCDSAAAGHTPPADIATNIMEVIPC